MTLNIDLTEHEARTLIYACELTQDVWDTGHVRVADLARASDAPAEKPLEGARAKLVRAFEREGAPRRGRDRAPSGRRQSGEARTNS